MVLAILASLFVATPSAHAAACATSSPSSGTYSVTICLTEPAAGVTLSGRSRVSATVSVTSGGPSVEHVVFSVDGTYVLTDLDGAREFLLPSHRWVDGSHRISVRAEMKDDFVTSEAAADVSFLNGTVVPPTRTNTFTPRTGTTPEDGEPFVLAAVGDGAAGKPNDRAVSDLIASWDPNMFLYLADVYENGTFTEFENHYGIGSEGLSRLREVTNPVVGNHEYGTPGAEGYLDYWDGPPNYYSVTAGGWQVIALDSSSDLGQRLPGTDQFEWLRDQLTQDPNPCKIVFFHHPRFSGTRGESSALTELWGLLADNGVDIVLNGHDHNYQRWSPMDASGTVTPSGTTQFVVGTGGKSVYAFQYPDERIATGIDTAPDGYGALRMELNDEGAGYGYETVDGRLLDAGTVACDPTAADTSPPSEPGGLSATYDSGRVELAWSRSKDNVGVSSYEIYRNGTLLESVTPRTSFSDGTVVPDTTYTYSVVAKDAADNASMPSSPAVVTTPTFTPLLFGDDFESGDLSRWDVSNGMVVQDEEVHGGAFAARAVGITGTQYARKFLAAPSSDVFFATRFKKIEQSSDFVYLQRVRSSTGSVLGGLFLTKYGELGLRNQVAGVSLKTGRGTVGEGWHDLQLRATVDGDAPGFRVWLDGEERTELSGSGSLGSAALGGVELGESASGRIYDFVFDDVAVAESYIVRASEDPPPVEEPDTTPPSSPTDVFASAVGPRDIDLSWSPSTDDVGVVAYSIERNGSAIASVDGDTHIYRDPSAEPDTSYEYVVTASDAEGNSSLPSDPAMVTTPPENDTSPPSAPSGLSAVAGSDQIELSWSAATDDVGVVDYRIYRDGANVGSADATSFVDAPLEAGRTYSYRITALDAAGNESAPSEEVAATTTTTTTAFWDGFESGDLSAWSKTNGATVQSIHSREGTYAARIVHDGSPGYVRAHLDTDLEDIYYAFDVKMLAKNSKYMYLTRVRTDSNSTIGGLFLSGDNRLRWRNETAGRTLKSSMKLDPGRWYRIEIRVSIGGTTSSSNDVWVDGARLGSLSGTATLGTTPVGRVQIGETRLDQDAVYDTVEIDGQAPTTSTGGTLPTAFFDGFENGDLSKWSRTRGAQVQSRHASEGERAARVVYDTAPGYLRKHLVELVDEVYYAFDIKMLTKNNRYMYLTKIRTDSNAMIGGLFVSGNNKLRWRNKILGQTLKSPRELVVGRWYKVEIRAAIDDETSGSNEVWLDGARLSALSDEDSLGTTPIGRVQVGETRPDQDVVYDAVTIDRERPKS